MKSEEEALAQWNNHYFFFVCWMSAVSIAFTRMKRIVRIFYLALALTATATFSSCSNNMYKVKVVKPKKRMGFFDGNKDRRKKRTKVVTYKVYRGIKY